MSALHLAFDSRRMSSHFGEYHKGIERQAYLDALRGWAILGVIFVHSCGYVPNVGPDLHQAALSGAYGVQLFFVVSALTLTTTWKARGDGLVPFYIRRVFRIGPMFWLAIPAFLALRVLEPGGTGAYPVSVWQIMTTATFMHGWWPDTFTSIVPGGWSVAVEVAFYALFPILMARVRSLAAAIVGFVGAIVAGHVLSPVVEAHYQGEYPTLLGFYLYVAFWNQFPVFFVGIGLFFVLRKFHPPKPVVRLMLAATIGLMIYLAFFNIRGPKNIQYALCFGALAFCLANETGRLLVARPICYLGKISYSAYLWHFALLALIGAWGGMDVLSGHFSPDGYGVDALFFVFFVAMTVVTGIASSFTFHFVERPMIELGRRLARRQAAAIQKRAASTP
jgi:peptidoglycan/LPS O-acetylase OafA/YrhL